MLVVRDTKNFFRDRFREIAGLPSLSHNTTDLKTKLKRAGIDTNSKQYKSAISSMGGAGYTTIECIKNKMRLYDKDGNRVDGLDISKTTNKENFNIII